MEIKNCQNCKKNFTIEQEDFSFYEKIAVPSPTFCPECRLIRRMVWRNERVFHKRKCDIEGHDHLIISIFSNEYKGLVYEKDYWWSDEWDPTEYGVDYDFSKNFFTQLVSLMHSVPLPSIWTVAMINSDYTNYSGHSKNIYLSCSVLDSEDSYYVFFADRAYEAVDAVQIADVDLVYKIINCDHTSTSTHCVDSRSCVSSHFLFDCINCVDCCMSSNLRNKQYVFRNKQLNREEYLKEIEQLNLESRDSINKSFLEFKELIKNSIHKYAHIINAPNCTGNNILNSDNIKDSYFIQNAQNLKYSWRIPKGKDSQDMSGGIQTELCYEGTIGGIRPYNSHFYTHSSLCTNLEYSIFCNSCENLFGCVGLKNKKYCIFNKQYSEKEYEVLVSKIKLQMNEIPYTSKNGTIYKYGEFFPVEFSPFGYNESPAMDDCPLTEKEINDQGFNYVKKEEQKYKATISEAPDSIEDTPDSIVDEIISCKHDGTCQCKCTKVFRITAGELVVYKKLKIPIPDMCPSCRYVEMIAYRQPFKLWHRKCVHEGCINEFETSYSPDRPEKVYCEGCYQKEVL